ncbi:MAG: RhuM family protein [Polaromonas sp.]
MSKGELVLYATEDGSAQFFPRAEDGTVWLTQMELAELFQTSVPNVIVVLFVDFAELRAQKRKELRMADWRQYVDTFIEFNESPLLKGAGRMSHDTMVKIAHERYEAFDGERRKAEAMEADSTDMKALEQAEKQLTKKGGHDAS